MTICSMVCQVHLVVVCAVIMVNVCGARVSRQGEIVRIVYHLSGIAVPTSCNVLLRLFVMVLRCSLGTPLMVYLRR